MINLLQVRENIEKAGGPSSSPVLLVAVSKKQPIEAIREAYALGQRDFGENYVQELLEKAKADGELARQCPEIRWHFIGTLQSNKIAALIRGVPNLKSIQSIDSLGKLEMCMKLAPRQVDLFIQVKGGVVYRFD
jgi:PLP dependent protein